LKFGVASEITDALRPERVQMTRALSVFTTAKHAQFL